MSALFREGGPLKATRTGQDEYRLSIDLPPDARGHVGRNCRSEECSPGYFKVKPGTGISGQTTAFCPYCRRSGDPLDFITKGQSGFVEDLIHREIAKTVGEQMERALNLGPSRRKRFGGGMFSMELSYTPGTLPAVRWPDEEELRREVTCPHCTLEHAVFGLAVWCPDCGEDIFMTHASTEGASLKGGLADVERRRELLGARTAARDVENALEDVVSLFEVAMNFELRRGLEANGQPAAETDSFFEKHVRNQMQNIERAATLFREHLGVDLGASISSEDLEFLRRTFEKRHPITHSFGIVDRRYLRKTQSNEKRGHDVRVTVDEVGRAIDLTLRVLGYVHGVGAAGPV